MPQDYEELRDALEKLQLNDAALQYEPESSVALGPGFRAGFLGLLHMDIVQERLEREYDLDILATAPSVEYHVTTTDGVVHIVDSPADMPDPSRIAEVGEPWMNVSIVAPDRYIGAVMELVTGRRGDFVKMEYLEHGTGIEQGDAARDAGVQDAALRDACGLLRSTQVPHAGVREHGLFVLALLAGAAG